MVKSLTLTGIALSLAMTALAAPEPAMQHSTAAGAPSATPAGARTTTVAAPARIERNARIFLEPSDFGKALAAAILKRKVPVVATTNRDTADFFVQSASNASEEGTAERVTKVLVLGSFAGSGRRFAATVTVTDRDGAVVFAHNCERENFQSAAENVAKQLKKHIEGK